MKKLLILIEDARKLHTKQQKSELNSAMPKQTSAAESKGTTSDIDIEVDESDCKEAETTNEFNENKHLEILFRSKSLVPCTKAKGLQKDN